MLTPTRAPSLFGASMFNRGGDLSWIGTSVIPGFPGPRQTRGAVSSTRWGRKTSRPRGSPWGSYQVGRFALSHNAGFAADRGRPGPGRGHRRHHAGGARHSRGDGLHQDLRHAGDHRSLYHSHSRWLCSLCSGLHGTWWSEPIRRQPPFSPPGWWAWRRPGPTSTWRWRPCLPSWPRASSYWRGSSVWDSWRTFCRARC